MGWFSGVFPGRFREGADPKALQHTKRFTNGAALKTQYDYGRKNAGRVFETPIKVPGNRDQAQWFKNQHGETYALHTQRVGIGGRQTTVFNLEDKTYRTYKRGGWLARPQGAGINESEPSLVKTGELELSQPDGQDFWSVQFNR